MNQNIYISYENGEKTPVIVADKFLDITTAFDSLSSPKYLIYTDQNLYSLYKPFIEALSAYDTDIAIFKDDCIKEIKNPSETTIVLFGGYNFLTQIISKIDLSLFAAIIILPSDFRAICSSDIYQKITDKYIVFMNAEVLKSIPDALYYCSLSFVHRLGITRSSNFYSYILNNMYELLDRDEAILYECLVKIVKLLKTTAEKSALNTLLYGEEYAKEFKNHFKDLYSYGECLAFGIIAQSFVSWKNNYISMEDFYEIRDMFVAFNLPISFVTKEKNAITATLKNSIKNNDYIILNGFGKATVEADISDLYIKESVDFLNFDENE